MRPAAATSSSIEDPSVQRPSASSARSERKEDGGATASAMSGDGIQVKNHLFGSRAASLISERLHSLDEEARCREFFRKMNQKNQKLWKVRETQKLHDALDKWKDQVQRVPDQEGDQETPRSST